MKNRLLCFASKIVYKLYLFFYGVCHKLERLHYRIYVQIIIIEDEKVGWVVDFGALVLLIVMYFGLKLIGV